MPKFHILKEGKNDSLIRATEDKVSQYLSRIFEEHEIVKVEGMYSFAFGSVNIEIRIVPWHSEDLLVTIFSYVAEHVSLTPELAEELLRLNATIPFGSFGLTFDHSVIFSHSLAGANIDFNEFVSAVQTVATIADEHDEKIRELGFSEQKIAF